jgi:predicted metal-dependent phosphoesterase TrpH
MNVRLNWVIVGAVFLAVLLLFAPPGDQGKDQARSNRQVPDGYSQYVGALHEHSGYSDGWPGTTPEDYYASAKAYGLDFLGSSEHSDNSDLPLIFNEQCLEPNSTIDCVLADGGDPEDSLRKWQATKEQAEASTDGGFTGFRGFEWTNNRYGHLNVYFSQNKTNAVVDGANASMETFWDWFTRRPEQGGGSDGLATFNHPGDKGIKPEDPAFNWNGFEYVPEADDRVVGLEVFNGGKDYVTGGWYTKALDKGWHVGAVGAEDVHDAEGWGASRWAKTVLISRDRSEPALREAMLNRRMYAVLDKSIRMEMTAAGKPMGSRIAQPEGTKVRISASVTHGSARRVEIVSNGGEVVGGKRGSSISYKAPVTGDERYYFLRVLDPSGKPVAYSSPVWVRAGDLHVHTPYSHDSYGGPGDDNTPPGEAYLLGASVEENFNSAARRGLDYLAISDHNDVRAQSDPGFGAAGVIPIHAYENSLKGHAQMLGGRELYDNGDKSVTAVSTLADTLRDDGGVFQVNHPAYKTEDYPSDIDWEYRYEVRPDTVEVWNQASAVTNADAVDYWEGWLDRGERIGVTGGSDSHWLSTTETILGSPTTWVFVIKRSEQGILEGLKAGRTSLSSLPPAAGGARIFLEADVDGNGVYESVVGETVPKGSALRVRVEDGAGANLRVVTDDGKKALDPVPVTGRRFEHRFKLPESSTWVRAEVYEPGVEEGLDASCEPPTGFDGTTCQGVLPARAMTSAIYFENFPPNRDPKAPRAGLQDPRPHDGDSRNRTRHRD